MVGTGGRGAEGGLKHPFRLEEQSDSKSSAVSSVTN